MAKHLSLFLFLFLLQPVLPVRPGPDTGLAPAKPETVGMSTTRLAQLDGLIQHYVDRGWMPGGVFLAARKGKIVYYKNFGHQSTKKDKAYGKDDIFRLASMTKAVTSVAIMQLFEQGKLGLDDPLHYYLPAFREMEVIDQYNAADSTYTTVRATRPITIRHLLTHSSGIVYGEFERGPIGIAYAKNNVLGGGLSHDQWTSEEYINRLAKAPLAFQPGERYNYGLNMDVLGRVVEVVSGLSLSQYFQKNIFEPLGMTDTHFYLPAAKHNRLVPVYTYDQAGKMIMGDESPQASMVLYPMQSDHSFYAGGGGLSGTAMDYARFVQALVNGGVYNGKRILGRKTIEVMTGDQFISLNEKGNGISKRPGESFCLGFSLKTEEGTGLSPKSAGTYEWGGAFNTKFFIDPREDLVFVGMTQVIPFQHGEFWDRLTAILYGAIEE